MIPTSQLRRIERKPTLHTFDDPNQDYPWTMWLRRPNDLELGYAAGMARELSARYVTGGWIDENGKRQEAPEPYICNTEEDGILLLSEDSIMVACRLVVMQKAPEGEPSYDDPLGILERVSFYPVAWRKIMEVYYEYMILPKESKENTNKPPESP